MRTQGNRLFEQLAGTSKVIAFKADVGQGGEGAGSVGVLGEATQGVFQPGLGLSELARFDIEQAKAKECLAIAGKIMVQSIRDSRSGNTTGFFQRAAQPEGGDGFFRITRTRGKRSFQSFHRFLPESGPGFENAQQVVGFRRPGPLEFAQDQLAGVLRATSGKMLAGRRKRSPS